MKNLLKNAEKQRLKTSIDLKGIEKIDLKNYHKNSNIGKSNFLKKGF